MINLRNQIKGLYPFFKRVFIVFMIIIVITFLYWWFAGDHAKARLETNLFVAGSITLLIGVFVRDSSKVGTYSNMYIQPYTGSQTTIEDRIKQSGQDMERSWSDLMILSAAGILTMLLSGLIHIID